MAYRTAYNWRRIKPFPQRNRDEDWSLMSQEEKEGLRQIILDNKARRFRQTKLKTWLNS